MKLPNKETKKHKNQIVQDILHFIFFIRNKRVKTKKYKLLTILGLTFQFKCKSSTSKTLKKFYNTDIDKNRVLLLEANACHGENIPTFVLYLKKLGYAIDVVVTKQIDKENPLCNLDSTENFISNYYALELEDIENLLNSDKICNYEFCIATSYHLYYGSAGTEIPFFDFFKNYKKPRYGYIFLEHHLEKINKKLLSENRILAITDFNNPDNKIPFVNTNYFGVLKNKIHKNDTVNFITVGELKSSRRNSDILIEAVEQLAKNGVSNFKVTVIGRGNLDYIPNSIKNYFEIMGRVSYQTLFDCVQKSDYFLPLLDPTNIKHERYIKNGTSGTFNLIYGFNKPCIIAEKFAAPHYFNDKNSFIYKTNNELKDKMLYAIEQSEDEYKEMCSALSDTVNVINNTSFNNLKGILTVNSTKGQI